MSGHPCHNGYCTKCGKRGTTGGCEACPYIVVVPTQTFEVPAVTIVLPATTVSVPLDSMCPHSRPDWRICPWCNGVNSMGTP